MFGDGAEPRWASFDQKPAWFNAVADKGTYAPTGSRHVTPREHHADSRSRYTVMTSVLSWVDPAAPPSIGVLFRGKTHRILEGIDAPPWVLLQNAENGSYRTEHVVAFLEHVLPNAETPDQSIIVLLDYYAAHLSEEVRAGARMCTV